MVTPERKEINRAAQVKHRSKRRQMIDAIKVAAGCVDCGYDTHSCALDFDHIPERGTKSFQLSRSDRFSWELVLLELAKCEVVCSNCHRVRTRDRKTQTP